MSVPSLAPLVAAAAEGRTIVAPTGKANWLRCIWLSAAATPSDLMAFPLATSLTVTPTVTGEVRSFAGGVDVAFSRPGKRTPVTVDLPNCSRAQVAWLEAHLGQVICVRDDRGRKVFGVYWSVPLAENRYNAEASTSVDLTQVTYSEKA